MVEDPGFEIPDSRERERAGRKPAGARLRDAGRTGEDQPRKGRRTRRVAGLLVVGLPAESVTSATKKRGVWRPDRT
jgi:hypothetical protein